MAKYTYASLKDEYEKNIANMEIIPSKQVIIDNVARKIIANKARYQAVAKDVGNIPWQFIAVLHDRESGMDFNTHLHNGDSLKARTHHVPAGRPLGGKPPFTWEYSAIDALKQKGFEKIEEWPASRIAYEGERYNGFGYRSHKVPSPYLWSMSNIYKGGKYVADGVWDSKAWDKQIGIMPLISRVMALDVSEPQIAQSSRKLKVITNVKAAVSASFGGYLSLDYFNAIPEYVQKWQALGLQKEIYIIAGLVATIWVVLTVIEKYVLNDYADGRYTPSGKPEVAVENKDIAV